MIRLWPVPRRVAPPARPRVIDSPARRLLAAHFPVENPMTDSQVDLDPAMRVLAEHADRIRDGLAQALHDAPRDFEGHRRALSVFHSSIEALERLRGSLAADVPARTLPSARSLADALRAAGPPLDEDERGTVAAIEAALAAPA